MLVYKFNQDIVCSIPINPWMLDERFWYVFISLEIA